MYAKDFAFAGPTVFNDGFAKQKMIELIQDRRPERIPLELTDDEREAGMKKTSIGFSLVGVGLLAAACGSSVGSSTSATTPSSTAAVTSTGSVVKVAIKNFAFVPANLVVKVGQSIVVTNDDSVIHTFTALDKSFNSGNIMPGQSATVKISDPGSSAMSLSYQCTIHQYMTGTITVKP